MIDGKRDSIETRDGISVGVVLTVPPFPYSDGYAEIAKGTPITFRETLCDKDRDALHFGEVAMRGGQLVAAGMIGYLMVVTGVGASIEEARRSAYRTVDKVVIPNMRYRNDIGFRHERDRATLRQLGWLE
jgi:phosphoribosylamine--glycine ligase